MKDLINKSQSLIDEVMLIEKRIEDQEQEIVNLRAKSHNIQHSISADKIELCKASEKLKIVNELIDEIRQGKKKLIERHKSKESCSKCLKAMEDDNTREIVQCSECNAYLHASHERYQCESPRPECSSFLCVTCFEDSEMNYCSDCMSMLDIITSDTEDTNRASHSVSSMEILVRVREFVCKIFKGITDKGGAKYTMHLFAVENQVQDCIYSRMVALLHDVLEDTETTEDDLRAIGVPEEVIEAVVILTRQDHESYHTYIFRVIDSENKYALKVKLADLNHNMQIQRIPNPTKKDYNRIKNRYAPAKLLIERKLAE